MRKNHRLDTDLNTRRDFTGKHNRIRVNISTLLTMTDADDEDDEILQLERDVILKIITTSVSVTGYLTLKLTSRVHMRCTSTALGITNRIDMLY